MTSGGEEVWDFMRLDIGQGGGCGSHCGQQEVTSKWLTMAHGQLKMPKMPQNVPKIPQNEPKMSKMQANCE